MIGARTTQISREDNGCGRRVELGHKCVVGTSDRGLKRGGGNRKIHGSGCPGDIDVLRGIDCDCVPQLVAGSAQIRGKDDSGTSGVEFGDERVRAARIAGLNDARGDREIKRVGLTSDVRIAICIDCYGGRSVVARAADQRGVHQGGTAGVNFCDERIEETAGIRALKGSRNDRKTGRRCVSRNVGISGSVDRDRSGEIATRCSEIG